MTSKPFSGKCIQRLNPKLVTGSILENGFEATWRWKTIVLRVQMWHFSLFLVNFGVTKLKPFSGKSNQILQKKLVLKLPWSQKGIFWAFENGVFNFFAHFSVTKLKLFFWKARQSIWNCVNPKPDIESILENGSETTLRSKTDIWTFENGNFQFFAYFWVKKLKLLTAKARQSVKRSSNPKLIMVMMMI